MTTAVAAKDLDAGRHERTWWLAQRSAVPVDMYRILLGLVLTAHFARGMVEVVPWLSDGRLLPDGTFVGTLRHSASTHWPSLYAPRLALCIGAALGALIVVGIVPRIAAVLLYALSVVIYFTILPIASLDDYFVILVSFALALLPVGKSLQLSPGGTSKATWSARGTRVAAASVTLLLCCVMCVYLSDATLGEGPEESQTAFIKNAFRVVAILLVVPLAPSQVLAILLQLCLHAYLMMKTQLVVTHVALAATAVLFWGERMSAGKARWVLDGGTALATMSGLTVAAGIALTVANPRVVSPAMQFAIDAGWIPVHVQFPEVKNDSYAVWMRDGHAGRSGRAFEAPDNRSRRLVARLRAARPGTAVSRTLAMIVARRYCGAHPSAGETVSIWSDREAGQRLLDFRCEEAAGVVEVR